MTIVAFLVGTSLLRIVNGTADLGYLFAAATMAIAAYPMWRYLAYRSEAVPAFPFIAFMYGVFFGGSFLLIDEPYHLLEYVSREALLKAQVVSFFGILIVIATYYGYLPGIPVRKGSGRGPFVSRRGTVFTAVLAGLIGLIAEITIQLYTVPSGLRAAVVLLSQLALLAIGVLFYVQLRQGLPWRVRWFLWGGLVGILAVVRLVSGSPYQLIVLIAALAMVYITAIRRIPWRALGLGILLILPLLAFKSQYRQVAWIGSRTEITSPWDVGERAALFVSVVTSALARAEKADLQAAARVVAQRGDHIYEFAYYMESTPATIPFLGGETYADIFWKFVPRVLDPDKPKSVWGNELAQRYGLVSTNDTLTTVNIPQMVEMYLNFGVVGVVIGMYLLGQVYRLLLKWGNRVEADEWSIASLVVIGANILNIESDFLLVFGAIPALVLLLYMTPRVLGSVRLGRRLGGVTRTVTGREVN